jgi:glycosyltransferase 2 family protein
MSLSGLSRFRFQKWLQYACILAVAAFFAYAIFRNWNDFTSQQWQFSWVWLVLAVVATVTNSLVYVFIWGVILGRLGRRLPYRQLFTIMSLAYLARYIPGSLWSIVGAVYLGKKQGLPAGLSSLSLALHLLTQLISAALVVIICLPFWPGEAYRTTAYLLLPLAAVALALVHPRVLGYLYGLVARLAKQRPMALELRYSDTLTVLVLWLGCWLVNGLAGWAAVNAVYPSSAGQIVAITGVFALSWAASFLVFLAPSGLGVMEGTLALLLSVFLPTPIAVMVAILARVLKTLNDLLCAAAAWLLYSVERHSLQPEEASQGAQHDGSANDVGFELPHLQEEERGHP